MDMTLLEQRGLHPSDPRLAYLDGYSIEIFDRATLIPKIEERVYGVVAGLTQEEIHTLYSDASVQDYRPEAVLVTLKNNRHLPALCYNLPTVPDSPRNTAYAAKLFELAKKLSFPEAYLDKIQKLTF